MLNSTEPKDLANTDISVQAQDNTPMAPPVLEGIMENGYGVIPKLTMTDPALPLQSKAIYAYICSLTGRGKENTDRSTFFTADRIQKDLGIRSGTYYKYLNLLLDAGYIEIRKERSQRSRFYLNRYFVKTVPQKYMGKPKDPALKKQYVQIQKNGIFSGGYGMIPYAVMQANDLDVSAKAFYAYLAAFTGNGNSAFPSRDFIVYHLNINKSTYNKICNTLVEANYLTISQDRENGKLQNNLFYLNRFTTVQQQSASEASVNDCPSEEVSPEPSPKGEAADAFPEPAEEGMKIENKPWLKTSSTKIENKVENSSNLPPSPWSGTSSTKIENRPPWPKMCSTEIENRSTPWPNISSTKIENRNDLVDTCPLEGTQVSKTELESPGPKNSSTEIENKDENAYDLPLSPRPKNPCTVNPCTVKSCTVNETTYNNRLSNNRFSNNSFSNLIDRQKESAAEKNSKSGDCLREKIKNQIGYEAQAASWEQIRGQDDMQPILDACVDLIAMVELEKSPMMRLNSNSIMPTEYVRDRLHQVGPDEIGKIIFGLSSLVEPPRNVRAYLLSCLINSVSTGAADTSLGEIAEENFEKQAKEGF